ncbi:MAG: 3-oxoacyl-[acyl-carrier-protein] reductase [Lachnospiraceae bacterium]|nr:3-oxoacyl-[acyl-carrier-protein] reductase [Lachnospiraceae bacterium]
MFKKSVAVVTGASRGIGRALALELADRGNLTIINYNESVEKAESVKREIVASGGEAVLFQCDVSRYEDCEYFIKEIVRDYGRLDILVNNAGITRDYLIMQMKEEDFDQVLAVNLKGTFNTISFAARQMMKQRKGRIVNMASVVGIHGNGGQSSYSASKAGVIGLTKSVAKELAPRGITVNAVAPGFIETEMTGVLTEEVQKNVEKKIPLGMFGRPEDVAAAVGFLTSDVAGYITGQVLCVDGGMAM